ncbi:MAG: replication-associated recombination protein A [Megasphaera cerevisiae]|nr:replication-associated recombination protein A [Megasphaera cerevisiae]
MNGDDLFSIADEQQGSRFEPLAVRMRPKTLDDLYGQEPLVGPGSFLRSMIERDTIPSLLLYGPSGVGKTTLAHVIAAETHSRFVSVNAVAAGTAELRKLIREAQDAVHLYQKRTILFIDEIHRFNKGQQDVLLPYVEDGTVILIGATTENPYFEVNRPLLSRLRIMQLEPLTEDAVAAVLTRALGDAEKGMGRLRITASEDLIRTLARLAGGDARIGLNLLEQVCMIVPAGGALTHQDVEKVAGHRVYTYDKKGDAHYDTISAFIKSMRGSDPDAALHYLARMIEAGEPPSFIARRLVICAAEDVGLADPQALVIANAAAQAVQLVGWPEGRIILSEAVIYVACAPKSNSAYMAVDAAIGDVRRGGCGDIPPYLRDSHYTGAADLGHGTGYQYPHSFPDGWVAQQYLPEPLKDKIYYQEAAYGKEKEMTAQWHKRRGGK